eukprot:COSAG02_NODE_316_length_24889_cov_9.418556_6_plen_526_part_00
MLALAGLLTHQAAFAFPLYDPPLTAAPGPSAPTVGYSGARCSVPLVANAALNNYNEVVHEPWRGVPAACDGGVHGERWDFITLDFEGAVGGVQFDRYGGLWFDGVELLRTTTPEPATGVDHGGTHWSIEKDITDYAYLFAHAIVGATNASLTIPNTVTDVYTGTLYIRVTVTFQMADATATAVPPIILPLLDPTASPWSITGLTNTSKPLHRPFALSSAHAGKVKRLYLDIFLSNHGGSEEFWYQTDSAYREINVFVDGCLAAAFYPAVVVYTGGICPLLWRPLVSLLALDIPAYRIDITAFAGLINDGAAHTFSFNVIDGDPPKSSGVWYIDPVLIVDLELQDTDARYSGSVDPSTCLSPSAAAAKRNVKVDKERGSTVGSMEFLVSGTNTRHTSIQVDEMDAHDSLQKPNHDELQTYSHSYTLEADNVQPTDGVVSGMMSTIVKTATNGDGQVRSQKSETPYVEDKQIWRYSVADDSSFDKRGGTFLLKAKVNLTKERSKMIRHADGTSALLGATLSQNNSGL